MKSEPHRLLLRQLKKHLSQAEIEAMPSALLEDISKSYEEFYKEREFLEHTIDLNSQELGTANEKIVEQNRYLQKLLAQLADENQESINILKQYKAAIDASLIVSTTTPDGTIKYVNDNFATISKYSKDELIGKQHNIVRHPDNPPELFRQMWQTIRDKKVWEGTFANRAKDGSTYFVHAVIAPLLNRQGEIMEYMALRQDITKEIVQQQKVQTEQRRVKQILDNQESMIILFDATNGVLETNNKFYEISGFNSFVEFKKLHSCICELFEPKDGFLLPSSDDALWMEPILKEPNRVHLAMMKGRIYSVKVSTIAIDDKQTHLATFTDITEIEEARIKSTEAEREKANFLANMSHEIRTPMNAILGFAELLNSTDLNAKQKKFASLIKNSSVTLIHIINDILDFSKLESGRTTIEELNINPSLEFEDTFMLLEERARVKKLFYMIHIDSSLGECIIIDALHIKQILTNLIGNAIKFTPEQGTVFVQIKKEMRNNKEQIRFMIQDSGIGIPKDRVKKIFEPFSQADSSTTRKFGGTGLGLSISNTLVKLLGGELRVESQEGVGSKFYFDIEYKRCCPELTINHHLSNIDIYLFGMNQELAQAVGSKLTTYNLSYSPINHYHETVDMHNSIIITADNKMAEVFKRAKILSLAKNSDIIEDDRHRYIENFHDFPSMLYNELMRLRAIPSELENSQIQINLKVLIAEDYEINRVLIAELLGRLNIEYEFAINGKNAIEKVKENSYDLILMDINMPIMNGIDATKILINEMNIKTPIVALTANALDGDKERFLALGMADYLSKPIEIKALERVLLRYSNRSSKSKPANNIKELLESASSSLGLSQTLIQKLLRSYVFSLDETISHILEAISCMDFATIEINAHNLKSGAASLGLAHIVAPSQEMELKARAKDNSFDFELKTEELRVHFEELKRFIKLNDI